MRAFAVLTFVSITTAASAFAPCQSDQHFSNARPIAAALAASPLDNIFSAFKGGKAGSAKVSAGDYDEDAAKAKSKLDTLIKKKPLLMLSLTTCPYCTKAKQLLDENGAKYTAIELDKEVDGSAIRAVMGDMVGRTSVPAIWITRKFIGGFNDGPSEYNGLNTLNTKGELGAMLKYVPKTKHSSPR